MKTLFSTMLTMILMLVANALTTTAQTVLPPVVATQPKVETPKVPQSNQRSSYVQGYGFVAPTMTASEDPAIQAGGGVEWIADNGFGVGAELAYFNTFERNAEDGFGLLSLNAGYHFRKASASGKWVPFVTGGYTGTFTRFGYGNGMNFGGGLNYWFHERVALRVEGRAHGILNTDFPGFTSLRLGVTFR